MRKFLAPVLIGLAFLVAGVFDIAGNFELKALDLFRKPHQPRADIVIVAIDNASLGSIGRWPWDRTVHASLVEKISARKPRLIVFDVAFFEPQDEQNDKALAGAVKKSGIPVILAAEAVYQKGFADPKRIMTPILELTGLSNVSVGHVNVQESADGFARKAPQTLSVDGKIYEPLSFAAAKALGHDTGSFNQARLVDFAGPAGTFKTIPANAVLEGDLPDQEFKDKIVFIGATASDLRDYVLTPVHNRVMAGVEWHANVLDNVLQDRFKTVARQWQSSLLGFVLTAGLFFLFRKFSTKRASLFFLSAILFLPLSSFLMWKNKVAFPFVFNSGAVVALFVGQSFHRWYQAEMEKRRLRRTVQLYFSPQVVEVILKHPEKLRLGGERKEVTILFSDIRGFTTITETTEPELLSVLLHEYFTEMTEEILATDGVLDKFIGDAVMAFWGAPLEQKDQSDRAVKAALGMLQRLKRLQQKWQQENKPFVDIGIGIHTGLATVGNMGSEKRFDYTVIGDSVNAASRLEGLNKEYKSHLIISEATMQKLTISVQTKELGMVTVKGKREPIKIFEIIS